MVANFFINFILNEVRSQCAHQKFHIFFIWQLDNYITIFQWWKNDKVESWRSGIMSEVEIIAVEIDPISALNYKIHTILILQVRKLVIQVTSTSYKS